MNRVLENTKKLVWGLSALSITSCLVRNDYNVIFSFLILIILNNFYNQNPKLFAKIIIQISALLIAFDIIWLIVMMPTWSHSDTDKSEYWRSLSGIHTFAIIFAFLELILKGLIAAYLIYDFKQKYSEEVKDLYKLTYLQNISPQKKTAATIDQGPTNKEFGISADSDFKNPY